MIKAVLFDIDGVLLDSFEANLKFFQDIVRELGYPEPSSKDMRHAFHLPLVPAVSYLAKAELTEELERIREISENVSYRSDLLKEPPGCTNVLTKLSESYTLGIITSRNKAGLSRRYFPFFDTEKYFSVCITVEDVTHPKPHPEPLLLAAKRLRVKPSECVYVGDSHTDIDAGRAAGMKTLLFGGKRHADADVTTKTFKKIPQLIASL